MAVRAEGVRARLLRLDEVAATLGELAAMEPAALLGSIRERWAAERGLQLGAEIVFDIGNHLLSAHFGGAAESHEDVLEQLAQRGVLDPALRQRLKGLGGFRNILVHDYLRLDRDLLLDGLLRAPRDFADFAAAIRGWLEANVRDTPR